MLIDPSTPADTVVELIEAHIQRVSVRRENPHRVDLWDGHAAERVVEHILTIAAEAA
jgi:hypothetical protein